MKGGVAGGSYSGKRRWKGLVIGVLGLVFLSMLVPLLFLLGLHNGFHPPGYVPEQRNSPSGGGSKQVDDFVKKFTPTLSKDLKPNDLQPPFRRNRRSHRFPENFKSQKLCKSSPTWLDLRLRLKPHLHSASICCKTYL
ncbi:probable galacturonosyltransferase 7 isoform X1 [Malus domestica]|uniref:probable galacturonosyltransferase 7 isoform X1 n=1 Tax=Malus domestica TaxID=3750 RepID=UPI00397520E8